MRRFQHIVLALFICLGLAACGGEVAQVPIIPTVAPAVTTAAPIVPTEAPTVPASTAVIPTVAPATTTDTATLNKVQFAKNVKDQQPVDPDPAFRPDEAVYLALDIQGRPKSGVLSAVFFWHDESLVTATLDLAETNGDVLFSVGQNTFASFHFSHTDPLPISDNYHADVSYNDHMLGSYPFAVIPPTGALESKLLEATLARDADASYNPIEPATSFAPADQVVLAGKADLGINTWLQVEWLIDGNVADAGTRSFVMEENKGSTPFAFSFLPDGGWSTGTHEVVLMIDDQEAGRYPFNIAPIDPATAYDLPATPEPSTITTEEPSATTTTEELQPAITTTEEPVSATGTNDDTELLQFAPTKTFALPSGLFQIDMPEDWATNDLTDENGAYVSWVHPSGDAIVTVIVNEWNETLEPQQITDQLKSFITDVRAEPDAIIGEPETQSDGSVLIPWTYTNEFGGTKTTMRASAYAEQRGNKLSYLIVDVPDAQYDQLWENALRTIVNSYKLDPAAPIVP